MLIRSPKELALIVITQRKKLGLSQTAVADRVGLKQKTISGFENEPESTKIETLFLILSAVELDAKIAYKNQVEDRKKKWKEEW